MITRNELQKAVAEAVLCSTAFDRTYLVKTDLITRLSSLFQKDSLFRSDDSKFNEDEFWTACFNENDDPSKS